MIKAILTDVEGTITKVAFIKHILKPYAKEYLPDYVDFYQFDPELKQQLNVVRALINDEHAGIEKLTNTLLEWIETDQNFDVLNNIQGMIWTNGYEQGDFTAHIYSDAFDFLRTMRDSGRALYVYSTNSRQVQHSMFRHSDFGDISAWFKGYYDISIGDKKEPNSYSEILKEIPYKADEILTLSNVEEELDAAKFSGVKTCHLVRDGQVASKVHPWVHDMKEFPWGMLHE